MYSGHGHGRTTEGLNEANVKLLRFNKTALCAGVERL